MTDVKRKCLMLSDLQSGAEEIEYVLAADYDALRAENEALRKRVDELELAAHLAAADFEEARRVATLCLENIRSVLPLARTGEKP